MGDLIHFCRDYLRRIVVVSLWSKPKAVVTAAILCALLGACDKPKETALPADSNQWTADFVKKVAGLSDEDKRLLTGYMIRLKMSSALGGPPIQPGTTIGQAIISQKDWITEQEAEKAAKEQLKQQLEAKQAAAAAELRKTIILTFMGKKYIPSDFRASRYDDLFEVRIGVKNNGTNTLKGVRGILVIKNTFGDIITQTRLNIEENIPPGGEYIWIGDRKINKFIDEDQKLMNLEDGKFSTDIQPTLAVYSDGSTVGEKTN